MNENDTQTENGATVNPQTPDHETWIAFHQGKLDSAEELRLQERMLESPALLEACLEVEAFLNPQAPEKAAISEFEKAAVWRTLKAELQTPANPVSANLAPMGQEAAAQAAIARTVSDQTENPATLRLKKWSFPAGIAASFLIGVLGMSAWTAGDRRQAESLAQKVSTLNQELAEFKRPQNILQTRELRPGAKQRSEGSAGEKIYFEHKIKNFGLILNLITPVEYPSFDVEITNKDRQRVQYLRGFRMDTLDGVFVYFPTSPGPPGSYFIHLLGRRGEEVELLETYPIYLGITEEIAEDPPVD